MGFCDWFLFRNAVLRVFSSFVIISMAEEERNGCFTLCFCCCVAVIVPFLYLAVPWIGLWSVVVAFPGHTHLLLDYYFRQNTVFFYLA